MDPLCREQQAEKLFKFLAAHNFFLERALQAQAIAPAIFFPAPAQSDIGIVTYLVKNDIDGNQHDVAKSRSCLFARKSVVLLRERGGDVHSQIERLTQLGN